MNRPMILQHWSARSTIEPITAYEIKWHDKMRRWRLVALLFIALFFAVIAARAFSQTVETGNKPRPKAHATPTATPDPSWIHA